MKLLRTLPILLVTAMPVLAETPDDLLAAREAALLQCAGSGVSSAPAAAHDRYLLAVGKPQRFGTQAGPDGKPLAPVADDVPEALRTDFMVAPLLRARDLGCEKATESATAAMKARIDGRRDATPNERLAKLAAKGGRSLGTVNRQEVHDMVRADALRSPQDLMNAATVLSRSKIPGDLLLASELAAAAACRNVPGALAVHASAWDRWAESAGLSARYGTTGQAPASSVSAAFLQAATPGTAVASSPQGGTSGSASMRPQAP